MIVPLLDVILGRYTCQESHHPGNKYALSCKYMDEIELISCSRWHPGFISTLGQTSPEIYTEIITILEIYVQELDWKDSMGVRMCKVEDLWSVIENCFISNLVGGFTHLLSSVMWKMQPPWDRFPHPNQFIAMRGRLSSVCCAVYPAQPIMGISLSSNWVFLQVFS